MNSKNNNVFIIHKPHLCQNHNQKLQLVCTDSSCKDNGLICIDCLLKNHSNCKAHIQKYDEFFTIMQNRMENVQRKNEKRFQNAQTTLMRMAKLQEQFNELILSLQLEIEKFLSSENFDNEAGIIKQLYKADLEKEKEIIKSYIQIQEKYFINEEEYKWESQGIQLIESLTQLLNEYDTEHIEKSENLDTKKYLKVKGIEDLKGITCLVPKLRLELLQDNWDGIRNIFPKFVGLNSLQITAIKSPLKAQNLEEIISAIQYLPRLEKFKINLIGSNANEQTLKLIFKIIGQKQLTEFGISFGYSQILTDDFIRQINQSKEQLKGISKIYISNQLHEFTEQQQRLLQTFLSQIEFFG